MYNDSFRVRYGLAPVAISENFEHYDTAPHIHSEIEILYIKSGSAQVFVSDQKITANAGDIILVNPMEVHSVIADRDVPYHQRCVCFDTSLLPDNVLADELVSGESFADNLYKADYAVTTVISECFEKLFSAVSNNSDTLLFESAAYVSLVFAAIKKHGHIKKRKQKGQKVIFSSMIQGYLSEHFSEAITSEDAARELFYTQSYFCRLFRENFGVPFLEYLSMYRISKAKMMLSDGNAKISQVAEQVGFLDHSYFSRCFKRFVGVSPSEYQRRQYSEPQKSI
ncbi:MAG: AraC family transcriptional regulator [Clostridia bacterium]|nr:AraC family transcriptional regulator [Clostridia bacterium]